ncbi:MAG: hypothetical protein DRJ33_05905 [Candidatus Methanomethylicota archaeon]|uniref:Uncharacterized protein n=1 Tax=Thermoproteota archaeon TaxID=2056631 RepID=A0A497EWH8_9CREN|nr:MAG: hypothetical protein DRJ33_05905 [Candidatus Verstraetearchaeota archaeon]
MLDISLPIALAIVTLTCFTTYPYYEKRFPLIYGYEKLSLKSVFFLALLIAVGVAFLAYMPKLAMKLLILAVLSILLYLYAYVLTNGKKLLSIALPALFIACFLAIWNVWMLNIFASVIAIALASILAFLFTWRITLLFTTLLVALDIFHVFVTEMMTAAAVKMIKMGLPTLIAIPTYPTEGWIFLGLGDLLLASLLSIQTAKRFGRRYGFASIALTTLSFLALENAIFNLGFHFFPATSMIVVGWGFLLLFLKLRGEDILRG